MIDRFTQKAREAIRLAVETAEELEHAMWEQSICFLD